MSDIDPDTGASPVSPLSVAGQDEVLALLGDPATYGTAAPVVRIDTHGAIVFLAGRDVYKIKRAVAYPFMDFSTLERRRAACEAEIAINRPDAPAIYLGAVPITRRGGRLQLGGDGDIVEWAVHMRRFDEHQTLDRVVGRSGFDPDLARELTRAVLASHARAPRRPGAPWLAALDRYIADGERAMAADPTLFDAAAVESLAAAQRRALAALAPLLRARAEAGFVRRLHGDLHLGNIVLLDGEPVLFDAIEFDDAIATGDVLYDLAFLLMDLWQRGEQPAANLVLNRYLWGAGTDAHLSGLAVLPFFLSLRASIRAHVTAARAHLVGPDKRADAVREARGYAAAAALFLAPAGPILVGIGGLSGTGKSTVAGRLGPVIGRAPGAVHLRSDIERKLMFGIAETAPLPPAAYAAEVTARVYAELRRKARLALAAGAGVVVDAVHGRPEEREALAAVAAELGVPFLGVWLDAATAARVDRVERRRGDASDADAAITRQQASYDIGPLSWLRVDAGQPVGAVSERILAALPAPPGKPASP